IIQTRVERIIYRRIKKFYDNVSLLKTTHISRPETTETMSLTQEGERLVEGKKIEIHTLEIREEHRGGYRGNECHELNTPRFTVQGYILTLLDGAMDDKKLRQKYLQRASTGVDRLIYIVKDLDLITKLEVGDVKLSREDFDIIELIETTFELLEMNAAKKHISLTFDMEYDKPILVNADREKIQQGISNLLVNSIKYGQVNGTTEVSVENLIKNKVIVRVTDNGTGIPKQHIPRLFERFYRVDQSGSRAEGGSGL